MFIRSIKIFLCSCLVEAIFGGLAIHAMEMKGDSLGSSLDSRGKIIAVAALLDLNPVHDEHPLMHPQATLDLPPSVNYHVGNCQHQTISNPEKKRKASRTLDPLRNAHIFCCPYCFFETQRHDRFHEHKNKCMKHKSSNQVLQCTLCPRRFTRACDQARHVNSLQGSCNNIPYFFDCCICKKNDIPDRESFEGHLLEAHGIKIAQPANLVSLSREHPPAARKNKPGEYQVLRAGRRFLEAARDRGAPWQRLDRAALNSVDPNLELLREKFLSYNPYLSKRENGFPSFLCPASPD